MAGLKSLHILLAALILGTTLAQESEDKRKDKASADKRNFLLLPGRTLYADNNFRGNQTQASDYCARLGGELAKITTQMESIRVIMFLNTNGVWWMDGQFKGNLGSFTFNNNCTTGTWDNTSPPLTANKQSGNTCLSFAKTSDLTTSGVLPASCVNRNRVLCSIPDTGCTVTSTTTQAAG